MLVRKKWFRLLVITGILSVTDFVALRPDNLEIMRPQYLAALQGITIIFAILVAISVAFFMNYVKGIRNNYIHQVRHIRKLLWEFYEKYKSSPSPRIQHIISTSIFPLIYIDLKDWLHIENVNAWSKNIHDQNLTDILRNEPDPDVVLLKYIIPLEEEMNELGLIAVRSMISSVQADIVSGAFQLVGVAMVSIVLGHILSSSLMSNFLVINVITAVIVLAIFELFWVVSFVQQEAREEYLEPLPPTTNGVDSDANSVS
jgi:hypothetical protein